MAVPADLRLLVLTLGLGLEEADEHHRLVQPAKVEAPSDRGSAILTAWVLALGHRGSGRCVGPAYGRGRPWRLPGCGTHAPAWKKRRGGARDRRRARPSFGPDGSLRRVEDAGLIFTTALWTRKARDLESNPHVALLCHWPSLGRQAQARGRAGGPSDLAETLFARRDRPHQLQALVSRQGEPIADLAALRERLAAAERELGDDPIPCPADWGAFRVRPDVIEYWTAAPDAMHDRIRARPRRRPLAR